MMKEYFGNVYLAEVDDEDELSVGRTPQIHMGDKILLHDLPIELQPTDRVESVGCGSGHLIKIYREHEVIWQGPADDYVIDPEAFE